MYVFLLISNEKDCRARTDCNYVGDGASGYCEDTNIMMGQDPNMMMSQDPNMMMGQDPNMMMGQDPNMMMGQDPNMMMGQDPNMMMGQDPNMMMGQDPNMNNYANVFYECSNIKNMNDCNFPCTVFTNDKNEEICKPELNQCYSFNESDCKEPCAFVNGECEPDFTKINNRDICLSIGGKYSDKDKCKKYCSSISNEKDCRARTDCNYVNDGNFTYCKINNYLQHHHLQPQLHPNHHKVFMTQQLTIIYNHNYNTIIYNHNNNSIIYNHNNNSIIYNHNNNSIIYNHNNNSIIHNHNMFDSIIYNHNNNSIHHTTTTTTPSSQHNNNSIIYNHNNNTQHNNNTSSTTTHTPHTTHTTTSSHTQQQSQHNIIIIHNTTTTEQVIILNIVRIHMN